MGVFSHLLGLNPNDTPEQLSYIERAVSIVEPLLKQSHKYPNAYRKSVLTALEYAHSLAQNVPGPVEIDLEAYARDVFVHAILPSMDTVSEAFNTSLSMQHYLHQHSATGGIFALMGMRRHEKVIMGMEMTGQLIQRDVPQRVVYFTSHTIENPAPTEELTKKKITNSFFDRLVEIVAKRVALRKQDIQIELHEKDILLAELHTADAGARPALQAALSNMLSNMQKSTNFLYFNNYIDIFEDVLLNPEQHLRIKQCSVSLDSMGIKQKDGEMERGNPIIFNDLIGFDRRNWTVAMVHCHNIQSETFASRLDAAYRKLSI